MLEVQPSTLIFKGEWLLRRQLKLLENWGWGGDSLLTVKSLLIAIVAVVLMAGCGEVSQTELLKDEEGNPIILPAEPVAELPAQPSSPVPDTKPDETVAEAAQPAQQSSPPAESQPVETVAEAAQPAQQSSPPAESQPVETVAEVAQPAQDGKAANLQANRALMSAVRDGNLEAIKQQLAAGADVNAIDDEGLTPLDRFRNEETAALLYKHGAKRARDLKAEGN